MTLLGLIVVGALTASFVTCSLPIQIVKDVYDATTNQVTPGVVLFNADTMIQISETPAISREAAPQAQRSPFFRRMDRTVYRSA